MWVQKQNQKSKSDSWFSTGKGGFMQISMGMKLLSQKKIERAEFDHRMEDHAKWLKNHEEGNLDNAVLKQTCDYFKIDMDVPFDKLPAEKKKIILYGSNVPIEYKLRSTSGRVHDKKSLFEGIIPTFERRRTEATWLVCQT